jgi:hypothetical protein
MNLTHHQVSDALAAAVARIDAVLCPWGFTFAADEVQSSHCGLFASGHYRRGTTRIGLSCRATIDNIFYEHTFVKENLYSKEIERFQIGHDKLMKALEHSDDCRLICSHKTPDMIIARDGGDRVAALIHDLSSIAALVLREPCEEFYAIVRRGWRAYSVAKR